MPKRQPKRPEVMRSFRIPIALDRQLGTAARKRGFGKSLMLREIVTSWLTYERAKPTGRTAEEILDGE